MKARAAWAATLVLASAPYAAADDAERITMSRVRLTTEAAVTKGCTRLTLVSDDSVKDLRRKIVRVGGDTALLSFGTEDLSTIHAQVFRCAHASGVPPGVPPPPPGPPPPPPVGPPPPSR